MQASTLTVAIWVVDRYKNRGNDTKLMSAISVYTDRN